MVDRCNKTTNNNLPFDMAFCVQITYELMMIFDNILNRNIPWPRVPEEMSPEAQDLIHR
ncbi:hypothetical protein CK203_097371 [Vitis vinifera]|uniref:Uncharacterized protein n=1 Tax=Vitis vinifera TaxID=29760 RepID=A0A438EXM7_VITVI|nr:hypothetical protein CK203_097371 [Vitis vinifera]